MAVAKNHDLDWLPPGWKVEDKVKNGRKVRCFINVKSSQRLYSKASVLSHIRKTRMDQQKSHSRLSNEPLTRSLRNREIQIPKESNDCLDSLPPGWITEAKTRKSGKRAGKDYKIYIEPSTGKMFYSKPEVSQYLKGKEQSTGSSEIKKSSAMVDSSVNGSVRTLRHHKPDQGEEVPQHPKFNEEKREEVPQDLNFDEGKKQPSKKRKGSVHTLRCHRSDQGEEVPRDPKFDEGKGEEVPQDPKFDEGKTEVVPQDPKFDEGKSEEVPHDPKFDEGKNKPSKKRKVIVETVIAEGLPPGWIKEIIIKKSSNGVRKDPLYTNPISGWVFRSRLEVLRYLETGEISKHAYKRRDSVRNIIQSTEGSPSDLAVRSNTTGGTIKRKLFTGKKYSEGSSLPNRGKTKARNNALLYLGADVDAIPIEAQKPEGNENDVHIDSGPTSSLKYIFLQKKRETSIEGKTLHVETYAAIIPSKNEFSGVEQSKDKEECGKRSSKSREKEPKRNRKETDSFRRSSKRIAGIEIEHVTHSLAIERILRSANRKSDKSETEQAQKAPQSINVGSQEETGYHYNTVSSTEFFGEEQLKDKEECEKRSSEKKPKRIKKEIVAGIGVEPVTHPMASGRILRSAVSKSTKTEAMPHSGSDQGEQVQEAPLAINVGSQEEIVCHYNTESATLPSTNELLGPERMKNKEECGKRSSERKPKRNRKQIVSPHRSSKLGIEVEPITMANQRVLRSASNNSAKTEATPSLGSEQGKQAQEAPLVINSQEKFVPDTPIFPEKQTTNANSRSNITDQNVMIDFSRNTIGGQMTVEPSRNSFANQMFKEPPKTNSKERFITDELTKGREKEQQDSPFSFPWSDPCIEFAYKTLTGVLPLDDTIAIDDYVQHQIRTCSNTSNKNFTLRDSRPPGFSLNTVPSNRSNSITFPDPGPPGFSRGTVPSIRNDNFALPEARPPPGFPRNFIPSNSGSNPAFANAMPPGFSLNNVPSNCGSNIAFPDSGPPGISRSGVPSSRNDNIAFPEARPPGFSQSSVPSNRNDNFALPEARPPGFFQSSGPSNRSDNFSLPEAKPPGFSQSSSLSNSSNKFAIPDARPPGFSRSSVPSNSNDYFARPYAKPLSISRNSVPSDRNDHYALPDARPPGFSQSSVPSNSNNDNFSLPDARPSGFPWSCIPSNSGNTPTLPDASPPAFSQRSAPANSNNDNFALPDARPSGFPWSCNPSNSSNNPTLPDASPPAFTWSCFPFDSSINLNVAFPDDRPPGLSEKVVPSSKQQQQEINPAGPRTQGADFPLQGTMFSSWNRN